MKFAKLLDDAAMPAWDIAWLRAALEPVSDYGDRAFETLEPYVPGQEREAQSRAERIARAARALDGKCDAIRDALRNAPDVSGALARASMGDTLTDANFLELQRWFDAMIRVDGLIDACVDVPHLSDEHTRAVMARIEAGRAGKFGFYLDDTFDAELARARNAAAKAQAEYDSVRSRSVAAVAAALGRDDVGGGEFIVMRTDVGTGLPPGVRVVREAPTYYLCEIDADEATLGALERRDAALDVVARAEMSVRSHLSAAVREHAAALDAAALRCGELDVLIAAARFTLLHECQSAQVVADTTVAFEDGRFLPLAAVLQREGRTFTPLTIDLHDIVLLTGPNMGGKSVCLRTSGFIALLAQFGIPVPARNARVSLFEQFVWLGIGSDGDDALGSLLSSFAKEVVRLRDFLARGPKRTFLAVDEFARTTTPYEGKALLVALLRRLRTLGACGIIATHLSGIARAAGVRHYAVRGLRDVPERYGEGGLSAALATLAKSMDYTVAEVTGSRERSSDAIALAALLGVDDELVHDAYSALAET